MSIARSKEKYKAESSHFMHSRSIHSVITNPPASPIYRHRERMSNHWPYYFALVMGWCYRQFSPARSLESVQASQISRGFPMYRDERWLGVVHCQIWRSRVSFTQTYIVVEFGIYTWNSSINEVNRIGHVKCYNQWAASHCKAHTSNTLTFSLHFPTISLAHQRAHQHQRANWQ